MDLFGFKISATTLLALIFALILNVLKGIYAIRVNESSSRVNANSQEQMILQQLLRDYDKRVRPPPTNISRELWFSYDKLGIELYALGEHAGYNEELYGPVHVKVNILIRMLSKIDVVNMEYSMQITFREQWMDRRLAYDHLNLPNAPKFLTVPHIKKNVWMPDTFFPTEKAAHGHMIDTENMFLRIYPDGKILYSVRLSMTCSCPMYLQLYPMDTQNCDFDLISYAHTDQDIMYSWDDSPNSEPVQLKKGVGLDLPNFWLVLPIETHHDCISKTNTGTYDCLRMRMKLKRLFSYYVSQIYGPTMMIVVVSWVSFWIDMHSTAGRVALGVTTLLTMTTLQSSINAKLPPVSYVKAVDVWLGACQTFVFGALIEYAVVSYSDNSLRSNRKKEKPPKENFRKAQRRGVFVEETPFYQPPCTCGLAIIGAEPLKLSLVDKMRQFFKKPSYLPAKIDFYARFITPIGFIIFNIVYWTSCAILVARSSVEELK